jgi:hypothetical protein
MNMRSDPVTMATTRITKRIVSTIIKVLIFLPIVFVVFGEAVLHLWNWLMPTLFHLPAIGFWQAVGLLVLSWLLFGGLRGFGGYGSRYRGHWRRRMQERWEHMTPEEREKLREWMQARCERA